VRAPRGGARGARESVSERQSLRQCQSGELLQDLERDEVYLKGYQTFADAEAHLGQFSEAVYNTKRLHSSLGDLPPVEIEATYTQPMLELPLPVVR
jgi:putative transposase